MVDDVRCEYDEVPAKLPGQFVAFQCKHCGKKTTIPLTLRERFSDIVARMPPCDKRVTKKTTPITVTRAAQAAPIAQPISELNLSGPGTQLKRLLSKVGITATPNCSCNARAKKMDEMGIEWCEANTDEIVGWLKEEAKRRGLPFLAFPTKIIVQRAIKAARRVRDAQQAANTKLTEENTHE